MFIGEAPGYSEDKQGRPFVGLTGVETRHLLWLHGITDVYITNVLKCHPKDDGDPTDEEIANCLGFLWQEITICQPKLIIAAGRFAARALLGRDDFTMEMVSGIAYRIGEYPTTVIPMTHPAAGLRRQQDLSAVHRAFATARDFLAGKITPIGLPGPAADNGYGHALCRAHVIDYLRLHDFPDICAVDTEDGPGGPGWCLTASVHPGTAIMIKHDDTDALAAFNEYSLNINPLFIIHSALHDIPRLRALGITTRRTFDTMVAAYLLQDEPLGLKPLAWRIANVKMASYVETIAPARKRKALEYLARVIEMEWPNPDPVLEYRKGIPRIKKPQNIAVKGRGIIRDVKAGKVTKDGPVEPRKRWLQIKEDEGRGMVEDVLGRMPDGLLSDIDPKCALQYACSDADMTARIFPYLRDRIEEEGLSEVMDDEMGILPFIDDMQTHGIPCDAPHYHQLSAEYQAEMRDIERKITKATGGWCGQLTSYPQVSALLYDRDKLNLSQYLPKKIGKKSGKTKTGDDILAQIDPFAPVVEIDEQGKPKTVVGLIRDHRELQKLDSTYARGVPRSIQSDGRSHPIFRTTNTDTGRLSCTTDEERGGVNWMAQPKRSEKGKKLRNGVVALPGCSIVSADYSQIELRLTAEHAKEQTMISAFQRGIDLHAMTAYEMFFDRPPWHMMTMDEIEACLAKVDKNKHRLPAKTINFGIIYGISADGLYRNMVTVKGCEHWTVSLAQEYIDQYFAIRPGIVGYIDETVAMARRYGKVWDWAGRIRRCPGAKFKSEYHRAEAERQACNARIQGGVASIVKKAKIKLQPLYEGFRSMGFHCWPIMQIHDDIASMVSDDLLPVFIPAIKEIMERVKPLKAGVRVDVEVGKRWGELRKWGS